MLQYYDPVTGKELVGPPQPVSQGTAAAIKDAADQFFGTVDSAAKTYYKIKAMEAASKGQRIPAPGGTAPSGGIKWTWILGGLAVAGLAFYFLKKRR